MSAGGCFWGIELAYQRVPGVVSTAVGYAQGEVEHPGYEAVCSGMTGHTEVVSMTYDPKEVTYQDLCRVLFSRSRSPPRPKHSAAGQALSARALTQRWRRAASTRRSRTRLATTAARRCDPLPAARRRCCRRARADAAPRPVQYRHGIYTYTPEQRAAAEEVVTEVKTKLGDGPFYTELEDAQVPARRPQPPAHPTSLLLPRRVNSQRE